MKRNLSATLNAVLLLYTAFALMFSVVVVLRRGFGVAVPDQVTTAAFSAAAALLAVTLLLLLLTRRTERIRFSIFVASQSVSFVWWLAVLAEFVR